MNEKFLKLLAEKKAESRNMSAPEKSAKLANLKELKSAMDGMLKDNLASGKMKKVEIASDSEEGLEHGLDKAKEMLGEESESEEEEEPAASEPSDLAEACKDASPEEIDMMIKELEALKLSKIESPEVPELI